MTALDFSVVPGCPWADQLVGNTQRAAKDVQGVDPFGIFNVGEFRTIVSLDHVGLVSKIEDGSFYEIDGVCSILLVVRINETFSGSLVNDRILVELFMSCVADPWDEFNIHLPFDTGKLRSIVVLGPVSIFGGLYRLAKSESDKDAVKRTGVSCITFIGSQSAIQLADGYVRVPAVIIADPLHFRSGMSVGMRRFWSV